MTLRDLLEQLKQFPPDALVCAAEVNEAFAANIASLELVENAASALEMPMELKPWNWAVARTRLWSSGGRSVAAAAVRCDSR